jgi:hypothetical protein
MIFLDAGHGLAFFLCPVPIEKTLFFVQFLGSTSVRVCEAPAGEEVFVLCRSADRREKERALHARFEKRSEQSLEKRAAGCRKRQQAPLVIAQRVGKLRGVNRRAAALCEVVVEEPEPGRARLRWSKREAWRDWSQLSEGCYLLRSNVAGWTGEELWRAYIQLTEAELAFRIQKSDRPLRPIWHQKQERVAAHILVCLLAYVLWKTLARMCEQASLGQEPRQVFDQLRQIQIVDVILPTRSGVEIRKRGIRRPSEQQAIRLDRLGLRLPQSLAQTNL